MKNLYIKAKTPYTERGNPSRKKGIWFHSMHFTLSTTKSSLLTQNCTMPSSFPSPERWQCDILLDAATHR